jgi:hypothetical protein
VFLNPVPSSFRKCTPGGNLKLILEVYSNNSNVGAYGRLTYTFRWK